MCTRLGSELFVSLKSSNVSPSTWCSTYIGPYSLSGTVLACTHAVLQRKSCSLTKSVSFNSFRQVSEAIIVIGLLVIELIFYLFVRITLVLKNVLKLKTNFPFRLMPKHT